MHTVKTRRHWMCSPRNRGAAGAFLLLLLLGAVILIVLYFLDVGMIFGPSMQARRGGPGDDRPWLEEDRILAADKDIDLPKPPKAKLDRTYTPDARVSRQGQDRGWLKLEFDPSGFVTAVWHAEFAHETRETTIDTAMEGNIDVHKTYEDAEGTDPARLFFIAKGDYTEQVYDRRSTRGAVHSGTAYVTGWVNPDWSGVGKVTLTTDKTSSVSFDITF